MVESIRGPRKQSGGQAAVLPPSPLLLGADVTKTILAQRTRSMTRQELHSALDGPVSAWADAACALSNAGWSLGGYRFVVFSTDVSARVQVYVQLWSEPLELVSWEVSSGRWNPPADKWLAGERSDRISAFGFEIDGRAASSSHVHCHAKGTSKQGG